jgi:phospholipase C
MVRLFQPLVLTFLLGLARAGQSSGHGGNNSNNNNNNNKGSPDIKRFNERIKNIVVLVEENRSFDSIAGGLNYSPDIDGLAFRSFCNPTNASIPFSPPVCALPIQADVAPNDPNHGVSGVSYELYSTFRPNETAVRMGLEEATMMGFVTEQATTFPKANSSAANEAINFLAAEHIPVFATMAENYVLMDQWFAAIPGPTNSNRAYITSGTSHGFGDDSNFGVTAPPLPQKSIFQQLSEKNMTWINYSNRTFPSAPDASFYEWTLSTGKNKTNVLPIANFFSDAAAGTLPKFTYINPECCTTNSFHPPGPVHGGELFIKKIYEALRSGPQWNETLFIMTFDEHGGFADHVPPPVNVPAGDDLTWTEVAQDGRNVTFDFKRLGVRVPAIIMSPWVQRGAIEHAGSNFGGVYSHTSIINTLASVWDLDRLTPRSASSATFEKLIMDEMRTDTPMTLPEPVFF